MIPDAPVVSRRERVLITPTEANRCAFGPFCRDIDRLRGLTRTQIQVARLLALATLKEGFNSIAFTSLTELMHLSSGRAYRGLGANDLSPAVKGWTKVFPNGEERAMPGLMHLGIVQVDERARLESAMPITVWLVIADSAQWLGVPADGWASSPAEDVEWLESVRACRRRHTPPLDGLGADADLHDARATLGPAVAASDVPELRTMRTERRPMGGHSETQNAYFREKKEGVPKVGMALKLKEEKTESPLRPLRACSLSDLKARTQSDDEREAMQAMAEVFNRCNGGYEVWEGVGRTYADGAKWRNKWRDKCQRGAVRAAFAHAVTDLIEQKKIHAIGGHCHTLWRAFSGPKKSRNLLNTQC